MAAGTVQPKIMHAQELLFVSACAWILQDARTFLQLEVDTARTSFYKYLGYLHM